MIHLGIVNPGATLRIPFDTFAAATGANAAMSANAVGDVLIFKDSNTTARASTTGYAINASFSSITGINEVTIDLSSDATADFYKSGSFYYVVVSPVTIDGQTAMAFVIATFAIGYTGAILNTSIATLSSQTSFTLTAGPAEDDVLNGLWCLIHDKASAVQKTWCIVEDYTGSTKTVTLSTLPAATFTIAAIDNIHFFSPAPLQGTTKGVTLDVSSGGEAGLDWANIGSKTTTNALTNTSIITTQKVDVDTIKTNPVVNGGTITFPTTATLASTTNITAATGVDITKILGTAISTPATAGILDVNVKNIDNDAASASGTVTFPNATLASTTNITAGTITTATNVTTVNGLAANVITATAINADAITAAKIADGAIDLATFASDVPRYSIRSNTATAGGASTITLDAGASATNNIYDYKIIKLDSGTGAGQSAMTGSGSYDGTTKILTINGTWVVNPDNTTGFSIYPFGAVPGASAPTAAQVATAVWQDTTSGDFTVASSIGKGLYVGNIVPGAAGGHFIAGTNAATTITTGLTTTFTGNLTGSVGSVTGAVGSVTGAVGSVTGNVGGDVAGNVLGHLAGNVAGDIQGNLDGNILGNLQGTLTSTERNAISDAILARALAAETYAADGAVPTLSQVLYMIHQNLGDFSISGTTLTVKKLDGSTTAATYTLNDALLPTSRTRAT